MNILAIDTTGRLASAAVLTEGGQLFQEMSADEMNHLQGLIPMTADVLKKAGITKEQLTHIAVSVGPGSFTGIRIGMATAKTLAQALSLPIIAVQTLESFVYADSAGRYSTYSFAEKCESGVAVDSGENADDGAGIADSRIKAAEGSDADADADALICPMLDARRNQVYAAAYKKDGTELIKPDAYDVEAFVKAAADAAEQSGIKLLRFFGDGTDRYEAVIDAAAGQAGEKGIRTEKADASVRYQQAAFAAAAAAEHPEKAAGYNDIEPVYLRKAYAEQKLESNELGVKKKAEKKQEEETVWELPKPDELISYRAASAEDIPAMAKLDTLCFTRAWNGSAFEGDMADGRNWIYIAALNSRNEIIGFAGLTFILDEGEVNRVAVHPLYRGRGIADRMMDMLLSEADEKGVSAVTLEVREANRSAIALYKNHGFCVEGKREGYYAATGENALIMWKRK